MSYLGMLNLGTMFSFIGALFQLGVIVSLISDME